MFKTATHFFSLTKRKRVPTLSNYNDVLRDHAKPEFFIPILTKVNGFRTPFNTYTQFKLKDRIAFGSSINSVIESLGEPTHKVSNNETIAIDVLFYRTMVSGYKTHVKLHFVDDQLYAYSIRFKYLTDEMRKTIINGVEFKYLQGEDLDGFKDIFIRDNDGNHLAINVGLDLKFEYLSGDDVCQHLIEQQLEIRTSKKSVIRQRKQVELLKTI